MAKIRFTEIPETDPINILLENFEKGKTEMIPSATVRYILDRLTETSNLVSHVTRYYTDKGIALAEIIIKYRDQKIMLVYEHLDEKIGFVNLIQAVNITTNEELF